MEKVEQSVAPPGVVGGLLFAAAVVEVLISVLVEAFPHRRRRRVVVVGEGVVRPVVSVPHAVCGTVRRHVSRCRSLAVRSVTMLPGGDCSWAWAAPGHAMGL